MVDGEDRNKFNSITLTELQKEKKAAEMGYMSMNLINPPNGAFWGKFND